MFILGRVRDRGSQTIPAPSKEGGVCTARVTPGAGARPPGFIYKRVDGLYALGNTRHRGGARKQAPLNGWGGSTRISK